MDQDRCYVRPVAPELDHPGDSQMHPKSPDLIHQQDIGTVRYPEPNTGLISCAQYDFIATTLQNETGKHKDTLIDLSMFRTYCFKLEQLLAVEQSKNAYHQEAIHELQTRCQEKDTRVKKAEQRMWELQRLNDSLSSAFTGVDSNFDAVSTSPIGRRQC